MIISEAIFSAISLCSINVSLSESICDRLSKHLLPVLFYRLFQRYRENQIRYDSGRLRSIPCKDTRCIPYSEIRKRFAFSYWIIHSVFNSIADNHVHIGVLFL